MAEAAVYVPDPHAAYFAAVASAAALLEWAAAARCEAFGMIAAAKHFAPHRVTGSKWSGSVDTTRSAPMRENIEVGFRAAVGHAHDQEDR